MSPPSPVSPQPSRPDEPRTLLVPRRDRGAELPRGTPLAQFTVERCLGVGGHGIVYRAYDSALQRSVAIKEYMPATIAARAPDGRIGPRLPRFERAFAAGLASFLEEAKLLAHFDHPALVKVHQFWSDNGSAYMAMTLAEGVTMKRWLAELGAPPPEHALRAIALELIDVLALLHEQRCFHRDIAPDNILLRLERGGDGALRPRPLLLDFGSARRVVGEATQQLTVLLKSGYSPPEQYDGETAARQGPWTDVYALGAVLYTAITGAPPPSSIARVVKDEMVPAARAAAGRYSAPLLAAVDAALALRPDARLRSMAELRARLDAPWS
ncbi:MAG: serine/threonine protein kinase, partial [Burkholderiales bacterium]|nr:serine/threonine protein kinase [Burkholderiales bacterium]